MTHLLGGSSVRNGNVDMKFSPVRFLTLYVGASYTPLVTLSFCRTPVTSSTGRGVYSFFGSESTSLFCFPSHLQPSRNSPYTYTPSDMPSLSCSTSFGGCVTCDVITTSSNAHLSLACCLFTSCFIAVRKPWGLKKPVSQYALGRPLVSHVSSCLCLCSKPWNHVPSAPLSHDHLSHLAGILASKRASRASTKSPLSATVPAMASLRFFSVLVVRSTMMFRRSISCLRWTVKGWVGPPGSLLSAILARSVSNIFGTLDRRSSAMASTTSAGDLPPPPPPDFGIVLTTVSTSSRTCRVLNVRSAFGCRPNTSGESTGGSFSMSARKTSMSRVSGTGYPGKSSIPFSMLPLLKYLAAYVSMSSSSNPSVIRPPYWIDEIMYVTVAHVGDLSFLTSISLVWFWRNWTHAERSEALNSYWMFHPMGPNLRRS
mmetsp:Transcript_8307/g.37875  ORF Transcript_8307/g.37875 Transcript_8307/m.37875 type:complete len:428 (+) Transcript_8307:1612-2895(+)